MTRGCVCASTKKRKMERGREKFRQTDRETDK